jgi:hypothetical protein
LFWKAKKREPREKRKAGLGERGRLKIKVEGKKVVLCQPAHLRHRLHPFISRPGKFFISLLFVIIIT